MTEVMLNHFVIPGFSSFVILNLIQDPGSLFRIVSGFRIESGMTAYGVWLAMTEAVCFDRFSLSFPKKPNVFLGEQFFEIISHLILFRLFSRFFLWLLCNFFGSFLFLSFAFIEFDVDAPASELRSETYILAIFADSK